MSENIDHPTLKVIVKWRNYPSILALVSDTKNIAKLFFILFLKKIFFKKVKIFDNSKPVHESNIPVKTI